MQLQTLEPDAVSYNSIIHCCGQASARATCFFVRKAMQSHWVLDCPKLFSPSVADKGVHDAPQERCKRLHRLPWGVAEAFFPRSGFLASARTDVHVDVSVMAMLAVFHGCRPQR